MGWGRRHVGSRVGATVGSHRTRAAMWLVSSHRGLAGRTSTRHSTAIPKSPCEHLNSASVFSSSRSDSVTSLPRSSTYVTATTPAEKYPGPSSDESLATPATAVTAARRTARRERPVASSDGPSTMARGRFTEVSPLVWTVISSRMSLPSGRPPADALMAWLRSQPPRTTRHAVRRPRPAWPPSGRGRPSPRSQNSRPRCPARSSGPRHRA